MQFFEAKILTSLVEIIKEREHFKNHSGNHVLMGISHVNFGVQNDRKKITFHIDVTRDVRSYKRNRRKTK